MAGVVSRFARIRSITGTSAGKVYLIVFSYFFDWLNPPFSKVETRSRKFKKKKVKDFISKVSSTGVSSN